MQHVEIGEGAEFYHAGRDYQAFRLLGGEIPIAAVARIPSMNACDLLGRYPDFGLLGSAVP